jgi:hypothetical protein
MDHRLPPSPFLQIDHAPIVGAALELELGELLAELNALSDDNCRICGVPGGVDCTCAADSSPLFLRAPRPEYLRACEIEPLLRVLAEAGR